MTVVLFFLGWLATFTAVWLFFAGCGDPRGGTQ